MDSDPEDYEYEEDIETYYLGDYASIGSIVREVLPFELLATVGGVVAGLILSGMTEELQVIPGLLVITPAVLGMRGNISSTLGSRLGSAIHMGLITKIERNPELLNNIGGSLLLSLLLSFVGSFYDNCPGSGKCRRLYPYINSRYGRLVFRFNSLCNSNVFCHRYVQVWF
jgi:mgtE-like transporter